MRAIGLALLMIGAASCAEAADMPDLPVLRGSFVDGLNSSRVNWRGFYVGGQAGYGSSDENFKGSTKDMIASLLENTAIESEMQVSQWDLGMGKQSSRSAGFGGFAGYSWQWDDVVLGLEASYLHGNFGGSSTGARALVAGPLSDTMYHAVTSTSTSSIAISDMATFRGRAAYAYGSFLPYVFGGFALGKADISRTAIVDDHYAPTFAEAVAPCPISPAAGPPYCVTLTATEAQHGHLIYGYTGGLGMDINLIGGLFMRAEWEYVRFTAKVDTSINTVRAGLGYKF